MRAAAFALVAFALVGCQELGGAGEVAALDEAFFRCEVQPVLTTYCAQLACHGDGRRHLTLFARNRLRLAGDEGARNAFLSDAERGLNYRAAQLMVDLDRPEHSLLVLKPLEPAAGGYYHVGSETFGGGDVFSDPGDRSHRVLLDWASGQAADSDCIEPGSEL